MVSRYYALNRGENNVTQVAEGSSTNSKDIEVVVLLDNSPSKEQTILALQTIINFLVNETWLPA